MHATMSGATTVPGGEPVADAPARNAINIQIWREKIFPLWDQILRAAIALAQQEYPWTSRCVVRWRG